MWASEALERLLEYEDVFSVLDIGSGKGEHAERMEAAGKVVDTLDLKPPAKHRGRYVDLAFAPGSFDALWCSHVLEHQENVGLFLRKMYREVRDGGVVAITVPPAKHAIVGGHLTLWNQGLLLYNMILAGFDCSKARVSPIYDGYNISVIVRKRGREDVDLVYDAGDIETLAPFFPFPVHQGFDGTQSKDW